MPYSSDAQRRWAHTDSAKKAGFPTEEFDKASKDKKLPEKAKKMSAGGIVDPTSESIQQPDEFTQGIKEGVNADMNEWQQKLQQVKDALMSQFSKPTPGMGSTLGTDTTGFQGLANQQAGIPKMAEGGITFPHKEKSGPSINEGSKHVNYADGGMPGLDDFSVDSPSNTANVPLAAPEASPAPEDYMARVAREHGAPVTPPPPTPSVPQFNPKVGLPPPPPPPMAAPVAQAPAPMPPSGPLGGQDPIAAYLAQQKAQIGQYGPDQMMQVQQDILKRQNSPGSLLGQGLAGAGDAIMQGVARAGNPGFLKTLQERQAGQGNQQLSTMEKAGGANLAQVEAKMKLDAIDPNSGLSKAAQKSYAPVLKQYGWSDSTIGKLSAQDMQQVSGLMSQYVGKNLEMHMKQMELAITARGQNITQAHNIATEGEEEAKTKLGAAEEIAKTPTVQRVENAIPGSLGGKAQAIVQNTAGISNIPPMYATNGQGHMITSADGGKTWMPVQ